VSLIEFQNVSVVYPATGKTAEVAALRDIDLQLQPTEFVVLIGHSGCGKTTMLNLLAGFMAPTSGTVILDGEPITGPGVERGVVFQKNALMPWLSVSENVELGLKFQGVAADERKQRAAACLLSVGLEDFPDHRVYELSGGMQQRVGLARALASDPRIMLMDEPLGALDALTRESVQELILDLWDRSKKLVFFITHSIEEALFLATRLVVMTPRPGRIQKVYELDFSREFLRDRNARKLKSRPDFIALREEILELISPAKESEQQGAGSPK
jgi:taurine transport system ATP-binding protein